MLCSTPLSLFSPISYPASSPKGIHHFLQLALEDENGNIVEQDEISAADLKHRLQNLQSDFIAAGKKVKEVVDRRTDLYRLLDAQTEDLTRLKADDEITGIDDIDEDDPLYFIESDYAFFHDAEKCTVEDITNMENPKKCIEAMDKFVKVLQDNIHRFKHLPKGPLYKEIKLRSKKWAPLAEFVLKPYMFSFLVDNIVDGIIMSELVDQHFPIMKGGSVNRQGVVCPRFHTVPIKGETEIQSRITSISGLELENLMETVHYDDEDWGKFLSGTVGAEKIILMENENAAFLVMSHIRKTPWHCNMAYTLDGFRVYPFPEFRTKKIRYHIRPMYLKCIPNIEIMELKMKIRRTNEKISVVDHEIQEKRRTQMGFAHQLDTVGLLYAQAKEKEREKRKQEKEMKKTQEPAKTKQDKTKKKLKDRLKWL